MTKRSADEALVDGGGDVRDDDRAQSKELEPSSLPPAAADDDDDEDDHRSRRPPAVPRRLVSSISSCSRPSDIAAPTVASSPRPDESGTTAEEPFFRRIVSSIGSSSGGGGVVVDGDLGVGNGTAESSSSVGRLALLTNARILQRDGTLVRGRMTIDSSSGLIVDVAVDRASGAEMPADDDDDVGEAFDCRGRILSPGFIDIQLNGAYGVDFSDDCDGDGEGKRIRGLDEKGILRVAKRLVETGVTGFCPTVISSSRRTYRRILPLMRKTRREQQRRDIGPIKHNSVGADILGMHLEGPFFAPSKGGAHDRRHIVSPTRGMASVDEVYGINNEKEEGDAPLLEDIDIITLAPELPGALEAIQSLTKPGSSASPEIRRNSVVVSCGHTEATYEDGIRALSRGATLLTHLYNAMNPFHHRKPGLVGLLSSEAKLGTMGLERPFYSVIVDGIHVHESAVRMAYRSHPRGCVLVTDAMAAMGLGDGEHRLGAMKVSIEDGRATLAGTDTLAGSVASMDTCVRRFRQFVGCSIGEALLCATLRPATVLGRYVARRRKRSAAGGRAVDPPVGILEAGARANLVMLNDELDVLGTWVGGDLLFLKR